MNNRNILWSQFNFTEHVQDTSKHVSPSQPGVPPQTRKSNALHLPTFWHDRLVESGLVLSMALYYVIGNQNLKFSVGHLTSLNPYLSWPFLLLFILLSFYRLPFAIALLPFSLPFYLYQKTVISSPRFSLKFSLVEITLWTIVFVAVIQFLIMRRNWRYRLSWSELRERIGPFALPILVFAGMALISIGIAFSRANAMRAFREEVLGPLLYLGLLLYCIRSRQDVTRLLAAMLGTGFMIAIFGLVQYYFFRETMLQSTEFRLATVYGSGNSIGLLFDYTLPIGLVLLFARTSWKVRLPVLLMCIPFFFVLYKSDSRGSWEVAIPLAILFVTALAIRNRKILIISSLLFLVLASSIGVLFYSQISASVIYGHTNNQNQSTVQKRFYLWESALNMIHDSPWLGYGMDNWLCHYSNSWDNLCIYPNPVPTKDKMTGFHYNSAPLHPKLHAYMIDPDPVTGKPTGLNDEPTLSHPHNIFLQVWVSMGVFGLLAFIIILILFFWLFARIFLYLRRTQGEGYEYLRWMVVAVMAAMLAAMVQGQGDSAFLEQDLAFCFWALVGALLVLRVLAGVGWDKMLPQAWWRRRSAQ